MRKTPLWVYGTLRPGCGNDRMLPDYEDLGTARLPGYLYYHQNGAYPAFQPADEGGSATTSPMWSVGGTSEPRPSVVGNVLLANDVDVARVAAMELLAGYNAEWREVTLDSGDVLDALTFPWRRRTYMDLHIPSGDWYDVAFRTPDERRRMRAYATVIREETT